MPHCRLGAYWPRVVPQLTVANGPDDESPTGLIPGPSISHEMVDVSDPSDDWTDTFTDEGLSTRTVDQGRVTSFTCDPLSPSTTVSEACPVPVTRMPTPSGGTVGAAVVGAVGVVGTVDGGVGGGSVADGGPVVEGVPVGDAPTVGPLRWVTEGVRPVAAGTRPVHRTSGQYGPIRWSGLVSVRWCPSVETWEVHWEPSHHR